MYTRRFYRTWSRSRKLKRFRVLRYESDLEIAAETDLIMEASRALFEARSQIEDFARSNPGFIESMVPLRMQADAPETVLRMITSSSDWGVGPMASVAGVIAQFVGERLLEHSCEVIVENGGDIYLRGSEPFICTIFTGESSSFSGRVGFAVEASAGAGVCTSSGTVGHSTSLGSANAVTVVADCCADADAAATAVANGIRRPEDLDGELERAFCREGIRGIIACCGDRLATAGLRIFSVCSRGEA